MSFAHGEEPFNLYHAKEEVRKDLRTLAKEMETSVVMCAAHYEHLKTDAEDMGWESEANWLEALRDGSMKLCEELERRRIEYR